MAETTKFTPVSFGSLSLTEEPGTRNPLFCIVFSDSGGNQLALSLPPELSWELAATLAPIDGDAHDLLVRLRSDDPKPS